MGWNKGMGGTATARIGVDVGGTFTDFVLHDPARDLVATGKRLTTPDDPSEAIVAGIQRLLQETGLTPGDLHSIVHGTTLVTNTIIERTGACVGLLTTAGFRDVIEIGRETRYDLYDLFLEAPPTLVPRHRRLEIPERIDNSGQVLLPLDEAAVREAARRLVEKEGIEALAIGFLHSYRDGRHELRAAEVMRDLYPDLPVSLSSRVAPCTSWTSAVATASPSARPACGGAWRRSWARPTRRPRGRFATSRHSRYAAIASRPSKMRFAPGSTPGCSPSQLYWTTPSGSVMTSARLETPPFSK